MKRQSKGFKEKIKKRGEVTNLYFVTGFLKIGLTLLQDSSKIGLTLLQDFFEIAFTL